MRSTQEALGQRGVEIEVLSLASRPGVTKSRLRSIDVPAGLGSADHFRIAAEAARGAWITFLQEGDRWHPDRTRRMLGRIEERRAAWGYGARILLEPEDAVVGIALAEDPNTVADRLRAANVIGGPSAVVCHRSLLLIDDALDARFEALASWRTWLRLAELGAPAACAEPLVAERVDRGEMLRLPRRSLAELRLLNLEGARAQTRSGTRASSRPRSGDTAVGVRRRPSLCRAALEGGSLASCREPWRPSASRDRFDAYATPGWITDPPERSTAFASDVGIRPSSSARCEVSVVIPTRNRPRFLRQAVASALSQDDVDVEVIVIDDASDSPAAREALRFTDPRVCVEVSRRPGGASPRPQPGCLARARSVGRVPRRRRPLRPDSPACPSRGRGRRRVRILRPAPRRS